MKKVLTFLVVLIIVSCGNETDRNTSSSDSGSTQTLKKEIPACPILLASAEKRPGIKDSLTRYFDMLSEVIETENRIKEILGYREQLKDKVDRLVTDYLEPNSMDYDEALEKELNSIGFQGRYSEGMYFELGVAPILQDEINRLASEEFKLKIEFDVAVASAYDTEYPFDSMDDEMDIVRIGEKIMKQFPGSPTAKDIQEDFMQAVLCFTDFHLVVYPDSEDTTVIVRGIETDMYPSGSHIDNFKNFIKEMPQSKYTKLLKTILKNPSTIEYSDDYLLYLVVIGFEEDYDICEEKLFAYAEKGIDIPHHIIVSEGENSQSAIVYRFFTDQNRALKALQTIKKDYKNAQIVAIDMSGKRVAISDK